jgi:hypothetical protein
MIQYKETIDDYKTDTTIDEEAHQKLIAPPDFRGPVDSTQRYCTDVLCLFFIVLTWVLMTILGVYAIHNGDYRYIIYPLDYQGNICGTDFDDNLSNMTGR